MAEPASRPAAPARVRVVLLALAAIGGWLDGLTFVVLGGVFVSAVTGDLVQLGISAAGGDGGRLATLVTALLAFTVGAGASVALMRAAGPAAWPGPVRRPLLAHLLVLLALAALWTATGDPGRGSSAAIVLTALAAFAMGLQGTAVIALGIKGANVNAVTGELMLLGARLAERGAGVRGPRSGLPAWELALIVGAYAAGGMAVALAYDGDGGNAPLVWVPVLAAAALVAFVPREHAAQPAP